VFSISASDARQQTSDSENSSSSEGGESEEDDDELLGQVMSQYQTRHTIINNKGGRDEVTNNGTAPPGLKEDADYFKYQNGEGLQDDLPDDVEEAINTHSIHIDAKLLSTDPVGQALLA